MENNLNGKSQHNGQSTTNNSLARSQPDSIQRPSESYLAAMVQIISKSISLANAPSLTREELIIRARDWAEILFQVVPENQLVQSLKRAFDDHDSSFPLTAYELKTAYRQMHAENGRRAAVEAEEARQVERANPAEYGGVKCLRCRDTNVESIYKPDGTFLGARPGCNHLPVYPDDWLFKEHQRLEAAADVMFENARREGRNVTVAEMLAMSGIVKDMPKANVYDLKR
jgi:hypothetical protein